MIKKMLLLAGMAMALVAFAAPAIAQGEAYWTHTSGSSVVTVGNGQGNGTEVEAESTITSSYLGLNTRATLDFSGEVWNNAGTEMGEGLITSKTVTGSGEVVGIPTAICTVAVTLNEANWPLTLTTDPSSADTTDATLDIQNVTFRNVYSHGCTTVAPVPPVAQATGTATLTAETSPGSGTNHDVSLTFESTQDIYPYNALGEHVTANGHVALTSNGPVTLKAKSGSIGVEQHP